MELINLYLTNSHWHNTSTSKALGTAFVENCKLNAQQITRYLPAAAASIKEWQASLEELNGFFAVIAQSDTHTTVVVDRVRSMPLFYGQKEEQVFISDSAEWVRQQLGETQMDPVAKDEFQLAGYVTGQDTLYPNVKQLQAGELLQIDHSSTKPKLATHRWYLFTHTEPDQWNEAGLYQLLDEAVNNSIERLIDYAAGRQIVIPLSGGYDSRLIALKLKQLGYKNILTFTYGVKGNKESNYSKQVADALGLKWHFVEYTPEKWREVWQSQERKDYQLYASNWVSLPHIQDWLAVKIMKQDQLISEGAVFSPGHGAMAILNHLHGLNIEKCYFKEELIKRKYSDTRFDLIGNPSAIENRIETITKRIGMVAPVIIDGLSFFEWQERQSKFLVNSIKVYEYFCFDWWIPLYDQEFLCIWQKAPLPFRSDKTFYINFVKQEYTKFVSAGNKKLGNASISWKAKVKKCLPTSLIPLIKKLLPSNLTSTKDTLATSGRYDPKIYNLLKNKGYSANGISGYVFLEEFSFDDK